MSMMWRMKMTQTSEALADALWQSWVNGNRKTVASAVLSMVTNDRRVGVDVLLYIARRWPHDEIISLHRLLDKYDYELED